MSVLVEQIRTWRDDAFAQGINESALFWGEQIVAITDDEPMDIFSLAQIYYQNTDYIQAKEILTTNKLAEKSLWAK